MDRSGWILALKRLWGKNKAKTAASRQAFTEATLCHAATAYAAANRIHPDFIEELANAAYHALQDKGEEIAMRN